MKNNFKQLSCQLNHYTCFARKVKCTWI